MLTNTELTELNKQRKIHQIAFLVYDAEETMQKWVDLLDIGPWLVLVMSDETCTDVIENGQASDRKFKFICAATMAVSYTHLDVYKRQGYITECKADYSG